MAPRYSTRDLLAMRAASQSSFILVNIRVCRACRAGPGARVFFLATFCSKSDSSRDKILDVAINRHRAVGFFILLAGTIATVLISVKTFGEPTYKGRSLSVWLNEIDLSGSTRDKKAQEALRRMGTNALPHLVSMYRSKDSAPKRRLIQYVNEQRVVKLH